MNAKKFENMPTPYRIYNEIRNIYDSLENNIHDLVWQYGKKDEQGHYSISLYDKHLEDYCIVKDEKGNSIRIKKCIILTPDDCQVRGHIFLVNEHDDNISFTELPHQEFNVYSHLYRIVEDILKKY